MPGKKGDSKSAAKKGGKAEPEKGKGKEEEKKGKDDKKVADKKGGKDDKKKGKEEPKGKGKDDGKKGKDKGKGAKVVSESEDGSDVEPLEDDEELSDEGSEEDARKHGKAGAKGKTAKGKSKSKHAASDEDDEGDEDEEDEDNEDSEEDRKAKKKSKDAPKSKSKPEAEGTKKKAKKKDEVPPETAPEPTKKLFGFPGIGKSSKKRLKSTSRLFLGLGKQKSFVVRKKRRKSVFKNAPRLLMRFKASKKKKKEKEQNDQLGRKPSYMLLRIGGNKPPEKKSGFFRGLFGKKNADESNFTNRSRILGKVAGATNWLTKKFLSTKLKQKSFDRNHGRWGQSKNKQFPRGSRQAGPHGHHNYAYEHDYDENNYDNQRRMRTGAFNKQSLQRNPNWYEDPVDYYEEHENGYYETNDEYYNPYNDMQNGEEYYDDSMGGYNTYSAQHHMSYYPEEIEYYGQPHVMDPYYTDSMEYYDDNQYLIENGYEPYEDETEFYDQGQFDYYDDTQEFYDNPYGEIGAADPYIMSYGAYEEPYLQDYQFNFSESGVNPYLESSYNMYQPYSYTMHDVMEGGEFNDVSAEPMDFQGDMFRVPRPQVKLYGKERIPVELPPMPTQYNHEEMSQIHYNNVPFIPAAYTEGGFPRPVHTQDLLHPGLPQIPTPTAMLIKQANSPQGFVGPNIQSPYMSPMAQGGPFPPSPTPSRRSMGMMASTVQRPLSPILPRERFTEPFMNVGTTHVPMQKQSFRASRQPSLQRRQSPSPQPTIHGFGVGAMPPSPPRGMSSPHVQRPSSPFGQRKASSPASPAAFNQFQPQASFIEAKSSPVPMARQMPSRMSSFRTSPLVSANGSIRKQSPPHSPSASLRRPSPVSSPSITHRSFGARKVQGSPPRQMSPPVSPQMGRHPLASIQQMDSNRPRSPFAAHRSSPAPSRRSFAVGSESPQPQQPTGQRSPSPNISRRSTRLMRDPPPFGSPGGQMRGMGRPNIPMGTVKPSLGQMGRLGASTKNLPRSRASIRSNRSVIAQNIRASPKLPGQHPGMGITEQRHFIPPGRAGPTRNTQRPVGLGRPLMARPSPRQGPPSPQPSLKHTGPMSPRLSVRHLSRPTSPLPSIKHGSPLPMRTPSPHALPIPIVSSPFQNVQMPEASPYPIAIEPVPVQFDQMLNMPQSPMVINALQNQSINNASYKSPFQQPMQNYAPEVIGIEQLTEQPSSPQLSNTLQNPNLLNTIYTSVPQVAQVPQTILQQSPETLASPILSNALQNTQVRGATFVSPLQRPGSPYAPEMAQPSGSPSFEPSVTPYAPETEVFVQGPGHPTSPMLSSAIQNPYLHNASYKTVLQMPSSPYSPVVSQYDYVMEPGPGPLLTNALQNPNVRNATYQTHLQRRGSRYAPSPVRSPVVSNAIQNAQIQKASYQTQLSHPNKTYPYVPMSGYTQNPILSDALHNPQVLGATYNLPGGTLVHGNQMLAAATPPMLTNALQNQQVRKASYRLSDGTLISVEPHQQQPFSPNISNALDNANMRYASYRLPDGTVITTDSLQQQQQLQSSPNLSRALLNPNIKNASYRLPDGSIITDYHQKPVSPNLSRALRNNSIRKASYKLPDGTVIFTEQQVPTSPALSSALQNPIMRNASYRLSDGTIIFPDYGQLKPSSPNLSRALQNTQMRNASYRLPDGSYITTQLTSPSPNLASALQNTSMRHASYRLPDGSIISANPVHSPNLASALKNVNIKKASFRLPDESIFLSDKQTSPNLANALKNESLRKASFRLPDDSILSADPHKANPQLSQALLNRNLRSAKYRLPNESILRQGFQVASSPQLTEALKNTGLKNASYQLPSALSTVTASGLIIGPDGRYAIVSPQRKGPEEHWAMSSRDRQNVEDVWAAERVLPHGTVQNLTKWSMYRDENMADHIFLPPIGIGSREGEVQWVPDREGEPTGQWYDKVTQSIYSVYLF